MPSPAVDLGTGTTLTYSGFTYEITNISVSGITREVIETVHLSTAPAGAGEIGSKTYIAGDLSDPGEVSVEGHFNPDDTPPIEAVASNLTITFPSGATWVASAQLTSFDVTVPTEEKMTFSSTFKLVGSITVTPAV
jgi:hypothetical protein